jgi:hypothetical protein
MRRRRRRPWWSVRQQSNSRTEGRAGANQLLHDVKPTISGANHLLPVELICVGERARDISPSDHSEPKSGFAGRILHVEESFCVD